MDFEFLFLMSCLLNILLFSLIIALWNSRDYWRRKWEKELKVIYKGRIDI